MIVHEGPLQTRKGKLPLSLQEEIYDPWGGFMRALIEFLVRQIGRWMWHAQEFIVGDPPRLGHSAPGFHKLVGND